MQMNYRLKKLREKENLDKLLQELQIVLEGLSFREASLRAQIGEKTAKLAMLSRHREYAMNTMKAHLRADIHSNMDFQDVFIVMTLIEDVMKEHSSTYQEEQFLRQSLSDVVIDQNHVVSRAAALICKYHGF